MQGSKFIVFLVNLAKNGPRPNQGITFSDKHAEGTEPQGHNVLTKISNQKS